MPPIIFDSFLHGPDLIELELMLWSALRGVERFGQRRRTLRVAHVRVSAVVVLSAAIHRSNVQDIAHVMWEDFPMIRSEKAVVQPPSASLP